jgi:Phosphotransferase enzyme family
MTQIEGLQRDQATEMLREALAGHTYDAAQLTVVSSQELTSAIGRRRVVQYIVEGLDPTGPALLIAKTFSESHRAQLLCAHLQALSCGPFAFGRFRVPQLLAFLREQNLVLYRACTGVPLNESIYNGGSIDGVRDAARWLAKLHMSAVQLPRTFDTEREVASTHAWAAVVSRHSPKLLEPAQRLSSLWAAPGPPTPLGTQAPIHKDFHSGHVLVGDSVCVIDLDEARHGDRAFDLAHFCAYLEFDGDTGTRREAFLREYSFLTGWADDGSMARFGAYTWLKIAKQLALRSGPCRTGIDDWEVGDALARGMACLAR